MRRLALVVMTIVAIAACQNPTNQPSSETVSATSSNPADCRIIEHEMGETEICGQPQRIVVLAPYHLESLLALDIQPAGFANTDVFRRGDFTEPSKQIPYLGSYITQPIANFGARTHPSLEAMLKIQPDLIIDDAGGDTNRYRTLSKIAPTISLQFNQVEENLRIIAKAVDRPDRSKQLLTEVEKQVTAARQIFAPLVETHPNILILQISQFSELYLGNYSYGNCGALLKELGFQLMLPPGLENVEPNPHIPISLETLPQMNDADMIVINSRNSSEIGQFDNIDRFAETQSSAIRQAWEENAIAQSLNASKAGRVYFIPYHLCILPGPIGTKLYLEELKEQLLRSN